MRLYVRVIAEDEGWGPAEVEAVLAELGIELLEPVTPHVKGGFKLFFEVPAEQAESTAQRLHARGLWGCL